EGLPIENSQEFLVFHNVDYDANQPSSELNGILNKGYYVMFAGTFEGAELGTQALPEATISVRTVIKTSVGSTFFPIADGYGQYPDLDVSTKGVHVDHHNIILIPVDDERENFYIINANDGGLAFSRDGGQTFVQTGDTFKEGFGADNSITYPTTLGYNTSQFYGVDKMNGEDRYIGGTQDNGSWVSPTDAGIRSEWAPAPSGDGFEAAWNYGNPDLLLESSQFNNVFRSDDRGLSWNSVNMPGNGPFVTRIEASKQDPDLVFGISDLGVLKSTDFGLSWTPAEMPDDWQFNGNPVAVSEASPRIVWNGGVFDENVGMVVSTDGGDSFQSTNGYTEATLGSISGIGTHPLNKNKGYALFSIADGPKVLATDDLGATWTDLSGFGTNQPESNNGFPDVATFSLLVMPFDTNQIWVGTEVGLFESLDGGASWNYADNGLPPVMIYEMKIVNDEVVLATHGRGIWSVSLPQLTGYEPLPALIAPQVNITGSGLNGQIAGDANLRGAYDSTILEIFLPSDEEPILIERTVLAGNTERTSEPFEFQTNLTTDTIISAIVQLTAYKDGEALTSRSNALVYDVDEDEIVTYSDDFDSGKSDFARLGFNIYQADGFENQALHSPHPYPGNNQEFIAVFQKPIMVEAATSLLTFDEVVLVEIGDSDDFENPEFYDFVTVEATKDNGQTWITLDGYDSSREEDWTTAYELGFDGNSDLIQSHQIGLSGFFEAGDIIYLRFRLVSDPLVEGWGWMIDNLALKSEITAVKELHESVALKNFPNPFTVSTILEYSLPQKSEVRATLYSLDGKLVSNLFQATQQAGQHRYQVNTSSLAAGTYICRFMVNDTEKTLKWVKH
ncbi:MAG: T9SS type A sorting domain-containing protein, partial [Saprospiraceae bacterium]